MKAAVLHGARDVRIETVADALPPSAREVRLRILAAGLCGTDVHEYLHSPVFAPLVERHPGSGHLGPMIIGHEFLGLVEEIGGQVEGFSVGDRVVAGAGQWCGECRWCREGRTNLCANYFTFGLNANGGLAEFLTVPAQMLVRVPEGVSELDAVLAQPVAVAVHAVRRSGARPTDEVAVLGAGAIGALVVAALRDAGVSPVVFDIDSDRLRVAEELGAKRAVALDPGLGDADPGLAGRARSFDIAFDTTGIPTSLGTAIGLVRRGGRAMAVGLPGNPVSIDSHDAVVREIDITTSSAHVCEVDLPAAVSLLTERSISAQIVGEVVELDGLIDALERLARRESVGKTIVRIAAENGQSEN
jgi:(R,R)-butanediol dehydrogenase / meso-butanediol dehydrogenase / diacetyl reductase